MSGFFLNRDVIAKLFDGDKRSIAAFEEQQRKLAEVDSVVTTNLDATTALKDASIVTLSANAELTNERVLAFGRGIAGKVTDAQIILSATGPTVNGGFEVQFAIAGDATLSLPLAGILATRDHTETLERKTLAAPKLSGLGDYVDDAAAAVGLVPVGGIYRTGSALKVRVV